MPDDGSYSGPGPVDSVPRLYVRRSGTSPLVVVVGKPLDSILSLWRTEAIRIGAIMMALIAFVLAVTLFLGREISRRAQAEDKLEELATTDALTGLRNRRKFDAVIDAEWRRAARQNTPIALLMIDADHFKAYNDTYRAPGRRSGAGLHRHLHLGLGAAGRRLRRALRRRGICRAVARARRDGRAAGRRNHPAEGRGIVGRATTSTVSIGVASLTPVPAMDWTGLLNAADKALYAAKANGRNQSVLASFPKLSLVA